MQARLIFLLFIFLSACIDNKKDNKNKTEVQILSEKIKKDPKDLELWRKRSNYYRSKGRLESAIYDQKMLISLDSLNYIYHYEIADIYLESLKKGQGKPDYYKLGKYHIDKSITLNADYPKAYTLKGKFLLTAYADYKSAITSFNASLKQDYNDAETHFWMGYAFKQLNQIDNAINCFRNSLNINPNYFEAHHQLAMIFHLSLDSMAVMYYDNALDISPNNEMVLYNKALYYQNIKDWNNALENYALLHKVNAFHSSGHYNLGFIHMELGLYDIAVNNFSDAIYSNSQFYEAYYSRGNCFETLGNIAQAESDYNRAIEINPDYDFAKEALQELRRKNKKYNNR